jgi:hypothetical protein
VHPRNSFFRSVRRQVRHTKALCVFLYFRCGTETRRLFMLHKGNRRVRREYPCLITSMHVRQRQHCSKWQKPLPIPTSRPGLCKPPPVGGSAGLKVRGLMAGGASVHFLQKLAHRIELRAETLPISGLQALHCLIVAIKRLPCLTCRRACGGPLLCRG